MMSSNMRIRNKLQSQKKYYPTWVPSKFRSAFIPVQSDQNLHWTSLDSQGCKVSSCWQWRLLSVCADKQADLSLSWGNIQWVHFLILHLKCLKNLRCSTCPHPPTPPFFHHTHHLSLTLSINFENQVKVTKFSTALELAPMIYPYKFDKDLSTKETAHCNR